MDCEGLGVGAELPVFGGDGFDGAALGRLHFACDGEVECAVFCRDGFERRGDGAHAGGRTHLRLGLGFRAVEVVDEVHTEGFALGVGDFDGDAELFVVLRDCELVTLDVRVVGRQILALLYVERPVSRVVRGLGEGVCEDDRDERGGEEQSSHS